MTPTTVPVCLDDAAPSSKPPQRRGRRRSRPLPAAVLAIDDATIALARYAFAEAVRLGQVPEDTTLEAWMRDAVRERAEGVARALLGDSNAYADGCTVVVDAEGMQHTIYALD